MSWSHEQRMQFVSELESAKRVLTAFYRGLMGLVIVGIVAVSVWVFVWRPLGEGHQGEYFYFAGAALFALGWALSQLIQPGRRRRRSMMPKITIEARTAVDDRFGRELRLRPKNHEADPFDAADVP